ncbi:Mu transposase C-terminal domain-containing protein [Pseudoalteromonas luteoviolacea]|uniref:Mu transposase C-terminal domain-containing protein n=1 Tax=Pseudoalteromonas luteoviolacea TaxID=43657 RepID=UPI00068C9594|nr:Mu transposase C-terminal domain-containing protein [Pseudoalteromonas luteoviolacea]
MHPAVIKFNSLKLADSDITWANATDKARKTAQNRTIFVKHLLSSGLSIDKARQALVTALDQHLVTPALHQAISYLGKVPTRATAHNWVKAYKEKGTEGLLPNNKGRVAAPPPWAAKALEIYHSPNSLSFAFVARDLNKMGYKVDAAQVRRFINSMPHELGPQSPYRVGTKIYADKHKDFKLRTTKNIPAGFIYNGDGHTIDVHLEHTESGESFRYELTAFQDVRSRKIVAWDLSIAENSLATLRALTDSIKDLNHKPYLIYVDNGSGYKNHMMCDENCGVYTQLDIEPIFAIPGNARAKWIERFFRNMEENVGKRFETYCGRGHDNRHLLKVLKEVKQGKRSLPTLEDWIAEFEAWLEEYHNSEHPEEKGKTRNQVWEESFEQSIPETINFEYLPKTIVNVRKGQIRFDNRIYSADFLYQFNGKQLVAGYSMKSSERIHLYEVTGEFLMYAFLKSKVKAVPDSRIDQRRLERKENRKKRLTKEIQKIEREDSLTRIVDVEEVELIEAETKTLPLKEPERLDMDIADFVIEPIPTPKQPNSIDLFGEDQ